MSEQYDSFSPQHVDESIEQITSINQADKALYGPMLTNQEAQLVTNLQKFYGLEHGRYQQALQRVEKRLVERYIIHGKPSTIASVAPVQQEQRSNRWNIPKGRFNKMQYKQSLNSTRIKLGRSLALVAMVLILLGSVVAVLNYAHQRTTGPGNTLGVPANAKSTATPTPKKPIGTTLYTTPSNKFGFEGFSWSPDSKRVADVTDTNAEIWDAATGKHKVTIQMPGGTSEWPWTLDWSHNSQQVAIATNQQVLIVNGQTGHILRTFSSNTSSTAVTLNNPTTSGISYLTSQMPTSGGFGYRATAWSPDSRLMASALSFGVNGAIQVWNPASGKLSFTLKVNNDSYNFGALSWSSDGQYIAASAWNTQGGGDPTQLNDMIVIWSVSTHQIVFQHQDNMSSSGAPVVWQPHTHNIAYGGTITSSGNMILVLKTWNVTTGKQVKQNSGPGFGGLAYSPDGKYLAYAGYIKGKPITAVIIMNVATGKQVYTYASHKNYGTGLVAWSPDGKYIVSDEHNTQITPGKGIQASVVAHVWIAE